jgi:hypothetical protein
MSSCSSRKSERLQGVSCWDLRLIHVRDARSHACARNLRECTASREKAATLSISSRCRPCGPPQSRIRSHDACRRYCIATSHPPHEHDTVANLSLASTSPHKLSPFMGSQQKVAVMDKSPRTRKELEALVLAELQAARGCGGASHVTVIPHDNYRLPATWEVASFNPGTSEQEDCERALGDIINRLQQRFDVSD